MLSFGFVAALLCFVTYAMWAAGLFDDEDDEDRWAV